MPLLKGHSPEKHGAFVRVHQCNVLKCGVRKCNASNFVRVT